MDYKEKYEKALEWMKSIYPTMQGSDKEDAEHYFPELAESEDERVRRGEIYAWLEKLKEPRNYRKLYEEIAKSEWFRENYYTKSLGEEEEKEEEK